MGTPLRQWAIRLLAAVALPIMLTLGLSAAAYAQPTRASQVTSSTEHLSTEHLSTEHLSTEHLSTEHLGTHHGWDVYGPFYYYGECRDAQDNYGNYDSYCAIRYRYDYRGEYHVWYLYVPSSNCGCGISLSDSRHLKRQM